MAETKTLAVYSAIANIQAKVASIPPDSVNSFKGNKYISLSRLVDVLTPLMAEEGLLMISETFEADSVVKIETQKDGVHETYHVPQMFIRHVLQSVLDGSRVEITFPLPIGEKINFQDIGSAITYSRRYAIMCFFNLAVDPDDDGESATSFAINKFGGKVINTTKTNNPPSTPQTTPKTPPMVSPAATQRGAAGGYNTTKAQENKTQEAKANAQEKFTKDDKDAQAFLYSVCQDLIAKGQITQEEIKNLQTKNNFGKIGEMNVEQCGKFLEVLEAYIESKNK